MRHTQNKFTPGPWEFQDIPGKPKHMFRIAAPDNTFIAESESMRPDGQANARLIAAAPDLLTQLELALDLIEDESLDELYGNLAERIRDAIAKAKGTDD